MIVKDGAVKNNEKEAEEKMKGNMRVEPVAMREET